MIIMNRTYYVNVEKVASKDIPKYIEDINLTLKREPPLFLEKENIKDLIYIIPVTKSDNRLDITFYNTNS